ncbi:phage major capsid protein [Brevundimonas sp. M1A4_2e]
MANAQDLYKDALEIANKAQLRLNDITGKDAVRDAEIEVEFDRMIAEATSKRSLADKMKAADEITAALTAADSRRPIESRSAQANAGLSDEERSMNALNDYLRSGYVSDELRDGQVVGTPTAGGHLVPVTYANEIIKAQKYYGALWNPEIVNFMSTPTGEAIIYPTFDDTDGDSQVAPWPEVTEAGEAELTFGNLTLRSYDLGSGIFKVSNQLLRDAHFNVPGLISQAMSERFGRKLNKLLTTGTGTNEGQGVLTGVTGTVASASALAITADDGLNLIHGVDLAYRSNGKFMASDTTQLTLRKMKNANGDYVWQESARVGEPSKLFGYDVLTNNDMSAALTANANPLIFGDFKRFGVRQVGGVSMQRLNEKYAEFGQVGFLGGMAYDCRVLDGKAFKKLAIKAS